MDTKNENLQLKKKGDDIVNIRLIISLFSLIMLVLNAISLSTNMITMWQMLIMNTIAAAIMMIMISFYVYKIYKMSKSGNIPIIPQTKVVIPKVHIEDEFISANAELLKKNIIPTNPFRACVIRISMEIYESMEQLGVYVLRLKESKTIESMMKSNFAAFGTYTIDTFVLPGETVNFKFDCDVYIRSFAVDELYVP